MKIVTAATTLLVVLLGPANVMNQSNPQRENRGSVAQVRDVEVVVPETQLHSLAEAGVVLGLDPKAAVEAATPRIMMLPVEAETQEWKTDSVTVVAPLETAPQVIGAPACVPARDVGATKTLQLVPDNERQ